MSLLSMKNISLGIIIFSVLKGEITGKKGWHSYMTWQYFNYYKHGHKNEN
jgi:hypothetical protein